MLVLKIYRILKGVYAVTKIAIPIFEDLFQKDLNNDGVVGLSKKPVEKESVIVEDEKE